VSEKETEDDLLRSVALQNAKSILLARNRAEKDLLAAKDELRESANRLQLALDAGNLGAWTWLAATDELTMAPRAAELFGVRAGQPLSRAQMRELLHPEDSERARSALDGALAARSDYDVEYRLNRSTDGETMWVSAKGRGNYAADGTILGMTGVMQDISARKRTEEALQDETRILELLNTTGAAIASKLDLESLVQTVTDAGRALSGARFGAFFYNVTDDKGESFLLYTLSGAPRDAFEKFGLPRNTPVFDPTFRGQGVMRSGNIMKDPRYGTMGPHHGMPKGHLPVCSYLAASVISRSGEVIGGLFFGHPDENMFTERSERLIVGIAAQAAVAIDNARLYEEIKRAAEERKDLLESERVARTYAERTNAMKDDFLATLSHELRTPLSAILGWAHALRSRRMGEEELRDGLEKIERNARMQAQLIEDLLDMNRITSGKLRLDVQAVQPLSFIDAAVETVRPAADAKGIHIRKVLDPSAGPINGDPQRLQQIVWNLLSNAIKFTPKDGKVQVLLESVNSHVEISVADSGIGIDAQFLPHVFERFRQADASTTRRFGGLGLGLSIVKHLVELHGGTVGVKSAGENLGTTFSVRFPVAAVHRDSGVEQRIHPRASAPLPAEPFRPVDLAGIKVLVVDDEPDARELIQRLLGDCGAEVHMAANAADALRLVESEKPHVLVSDIGMPDVDGYELLRRVRALGSGRGGNLPAIALTAFARSEDRTRALRAGFQVHVSKPVEPPELVATVANAAGRSGDPGGGALSS